MAVAGGKARSCAAVAADAAGAVAADAAAVVGEDAGRAAAPGACVRVAGDALVPGAAVGKAEHCTAADADAGNLQGQMRSLDASLFLLAVLQEQMALQSTLAGSGYSFHSQLHVVFRS